MADKKQYFSNGDDFYANLGKHTISIAETVLNLDKNTIIDRIWNKDYTVWGEDRDEIQNRLGWLDCPESMQNHVQDINQFVESVKSAGFKSALLLGMGGSSLAPEVFRNTFGVSEGYLDLRVLDSTDPDAVQEVGNGLDFHETLFIISTKSGGTIETISLMKYFYNRALQVLDQNKVGKHFIAITDPGSGLESMANELGFRKIFLNDPNIGGRYSALSYFGLVPAALIGINIMDLLVRAENISMISKESVLPEQSHNSSAWLGVILGHLALADLNKLTLILSPSIKYFGAWVEQLVAESTGKQGKGIVPVDGEIPGTFMADPDDRIFVYLKLSGENDYDHISDVLEKSNKPLVRIILRDINDLGGEFFRWEIATVIAGQIMGINPFDQPDVESAKVQSRKMIAEYQQNGHLPDLKGIMPVNGLNVTITPDYSNSSKSPEKIIRQFFITQSTENTPAYIAVQAYLKPCPDNDKLLEDFRIWLREKTGIVTTVGYGPRFLHSTGQLHKGDGGKGFFVQLLSDFAKDCPIPDQADKSNSSASFGILIAAQAMGDRQALINAGRQIITVNLGSNVKDGLKRLCEILN